MTTWNVRPVDCWYCQGADLVLVQDRQGLLWARCERCKKGYLVASREGGNASERELRPLQGVDLHLVRRPRGRTAPPATDNRASKRRRKGQDAPGSPSAPLFDSLADGPSEVV